MKTPLTAGIVCGLIFLGCTSGSRAAKTQGLAPDQVQGPQARGKPFQLFEILDYQTRAGGENIPEWVNRFLTEGVRGVESIPEFQDKYVFVGLSEGANFNALSQWEAAFSPAQDLARLVASRIEARFTAAAQSAVPGDTFGPFFETLIKKASDARYEGAVKETSFWVQQIVPADEPGEETGVIDANREVYDFLVLVSIDKKQLEFRINAIFNEARENIESRRDQTSAINRLRDNFFEGF
ncbi:hypothetical protein AGMMS50255_6040 [Spirochaetia bacterium]|nr:hypothetical protein AGMMS50255_6040 [Spirochaetia bacterium]